MMHAAMAGVLLAGLAAAGLAVLRGRYVSVTVDGPSMEPTLRSGDVVLVRRTPLSRVQPGQLVVFRLGALSSGWFIKRAAAVPGDALPGVLAERLGSVVPPDRLAVLGDNPPASADSRTFGYVRGGQLLGVVVRPARGEAPAR
jgi:signal peptidase I